MTDIELAALVTQYTGLTDRNDPAYAQAYRLAHAVATAAATECNEPTPANASWWCRGNGCVHMQFGEPAWAEGTNPFERAPETWKELPSPAEDGQ